MTKMAKIVEATGKVLIPNYGRVPVAMARGSNALIWDADGKEYVDLFCGFGAGGVSGHCHRAVVRAIRSQAGKLMAAGNLFTNEPQVKLAKLITKHGFGGKVFYCHSGAEANEAAIKLARLAAGEGKYKIISFNDAFHGRTMGALSLTPEKYQKGFEPMLPGNVKVNFGDLEAVKAAVDDQTAGIFVEPIQGEGGVNVASKAFMQGLRALCDAKGVLLICDEVWTAPARTGQWFAYQLYDMAPDIMTLGKACAGGAPLAAMVAARKYQDVLGPGKHGCTLGGNPLCAAAGAATFKLIEKEDLVTKAATKGPQVMAKIRDAGIGKVKEVRGSGFMIGIELDCPGKDFVTACRDRGALINCTQETVLRLAPPLTIEDDILDKGLDILLGVLKS